MKPTRITIIGAGLVGSLTAIFLAKRGYDVTVLEKRPDMRKAKISAGRSINLALANRGIAPLQAVGLMDKVKAMMIPMRGRMVHDEQGNTNLQPYGQRDHEVIYSISRAGLNKLLMDEAEATGKVTIAFEQDIANIDFEQQHLILNHADGQTVQRFEYLIGADGGPSIVRQALHGNNDAINRTEWLSHSYKELSILPNERQQWQIEKEALHIWPRGNYMLIALPNLDGSFTVTLFLPNQGEYSFESLNSPETLQAFFDSQFPDASALIPHLAQEFFDNPTGTLGTVRCNEWHNNNNTLLIGDAAHGIVPFHGQGMNCGFEDVLVLDQLLSDVSDDWQAVFNRYEAARKPNGNAIADMALENYIEMRDSVRDERFLAKKALSFKLEQRHPDRFIPRYSMVMFHLLPYADAKNRGIIQDGILETLLDGNNHIDHVDYEKADRLIEEKLTPLEIIH